MDTAEVARLIIQLQTKGDKESLNALRNIQKEAGKAADEVDNLGKSTKKTSEAFSSSFGALRTYGSLLAGIGLVTASKQFIQLADTMSLLEARIKLVKYATDDLSAIQRNLLSISNENRVGIEETTKLYTRLMIPMKEMGVSTQTTLDITNAFSKALLVGGASAQEAASATLQFAQAMASGRLQGDEFRSIAEASPVILQILSKSLNVTTGSLRKMAEEGKLTTAVLSESLLKALPQLEQQVGTIPKTVSGSLQILKNEFAVLTDEINKNEQITNSLSLAIESFTKSLKDNKSDLNSFISLMISAGRFVLEHANNIILAYTAYYGLTRALKVAEVAQIAFNIAARANPYVIGATVIAAGILAVSEAYDSLASGAKKATDEAQKYQNTFETEKQNKVKNQITEINAQIFNQEKALKGLNGTAKTALQNQINGLKAQKAELEGTLKGTQKLSDTEKRRQEDIAKLKKSALPDEKAINKSISEYNRTLMETIKGAKELNDIREKSLEFELEGMGLSKSDLEYQKAVLRINFDIADKLQEIDALKSKKYGKDDTSQKADKTRVTVLSQEIQLLQNQAIAADDIRKRALVDNTKKYYEVAGRYSELWAAKEIEIRSQYSNLTETQLQAVVDFEKEAFDQSIAMDDKRLKHAKTTADGISIYFERAVYSVQNDAQRAFDMMETLSGSLDTAFTNVFDGITSGSLDMKKVVLNVLNDILKEIYRVYIVKQLVAGATSAIGSLFTSTPSADAGTFTNSSGQAQYWGTNEPAYSGYLSASSHGNIFKSPSLSQYSNSIVSTPTMFAFANGGVPNKGIMGERGSEAILPLTRTASGDLGVKATGGSNTGVQNIKVEIINESGQKMEVKNAQTSQNNGQMLMQIWLQEYNKNTMGVRDMVGR